MAGNISSLAIGAARKTKLRGTITIADGASSATATISSVDTSKTDLWSTGFSSTNTGFQQTPRIYLTNSTTITATRAGSTGDVVVAYEGVEYY